MLGVSHPRATGYTHINIVGSGGGNATHLGKFTTTWDADVVFVPADNPIVRCFVAANGDELWSVGTAVGTQPLPPDFNQNVVGDYEIIGGTGRFEGASGFFTVDRMVFDVTQGIDIETIGTFDGTIILAH